jgi:hypothetical protein
MRTKVLCTSCEQYVYTDDVHSCYDAKSLRAVRDAEAGVIVVVQRIASWEARAEDDAAVRAMSESNWSLGALLHDVDMLKSATHALHAARQGVGA